MEDKFQREVLERLIVLETLLKQQDYKGLSKTANDAYNMAIDNQKNIQDLQEKNKWFSKTIAAAIIAGFVGLLFVYIKIGLGVN